MLASSFVVIIWKADWLFLPLAFVLVMPIAVILHISGITRELIKSVPEERKGIWKKALILIAVIAVIIILGFFLMGAYTDSILW